MKGLDVLRRNLDGGDEVLGTGLQLCLLLQQCMKYMLAGCGYIRYTIKIS